MAMLLVFPSAVRAVLSDRRRWMSAALAFALGALPLLIYNVKHANATLADNAHFTWEQFPVKYQELTGAPDGSGLQGYLVAAESREILASRRPYPAGALYGFGNMRALTIRT